MHSYVQVKYTLVITVIPKINRIQFKTPKLTNTFDFKIKAEKSKFIQEP